VAGRRLVDCLGPRGTVIVFDSNSIHRATDPTRGHRDVINFTVFPSVLRPGPSEVKGVDLVEEAAWLKKYTR
jgi:predicted 2-oxoglutarate/Fe(II)-dependent dioxygenase YbiX